ncbi:hypothetical protein ACFZCP_28795 [Streptomyces sp. NPDC007971]|uniref:hypothetical protein n=1 Tax=Streptomyces sp. NPDC007971 TaxID=3364799 RepID=UPI0036ECF981
MAALVGTPGVRRLRAGHLITPPHEDARKLGEFGAALADVLARHVEVTGIDDKTTFFSTFEDEIRKARPSVWLWAPWVANRVRGILPLVQGDDARRPLRPQAPGARARRAVHPPAEVRPLRRHEHRAAPPHERRLVVPSLRRGQLRALPVAAGASEARVIRSLTSWMNCRAKEFR